MLFFLSRRLILDFLYLLSLDESDLLNDESDELGSDSGSSGTYSFCAFSLCFDHSVGSVSLFGCGIFAPTGVESKGDIFAFDMFVPTRVESRGGRLIKKKLRSIFYFPSKFETRFYSYSCSQTLPDSLQPL